jgi:hypothetical protein
MGTWQLVYNSTKQLNRRTECGSSSWRPVTFLYCDLRVSGQRIRVTTRRDESTVNFQANICSAEATLTQLGTMAHMNNSLAHLMYGIMWRNSSTSNSLLPSASNRSKF